MNDTGLFPSKCAGGCGELMAVGEGPCEDCARLAEHYDAKELMVRLGRIHSRRATRRGLFTFLGWKAVAPTPTVASANQERVEAESYVAPVAADRERRSDLLAKLPRVQCGVQRMCELPRLELWNSDVPLCTVAVVLAWDVLRWIGCAAMDALACFCRKREWRGRLRVTGMVLGVALGLAVSCAAWGLR